MEVSSEGDIISALHRPWHRCHPTPTPTHWKAAGTADVTHFMVATGVPVVPDDRRNGNQEPRMSRVRRAWCMMGCLVCLPERFWLRYSRRAREAATLLQFLRLLVVFNVGDLAAHCKNRFLKSQPTTATNS